MLKSNVISSDVKCKLKGTRICCFFFQNQAQLESKTLTEFLLKVFKLLEEGKYFKPVKC